MRKLIFLFIVVVHSLSFDVFSQGGYYTRQTTIIKLLECNLVRFVWLVYRCSKRKNTHTRPTASSRLISQVLSLLHSIFTHHKTCRLEHKSGYETRRDMCLVSTMNRRKIPNPKSCLAFKSRQVRTCVIRGWLLAPVLAQNIHRYSCSDVTSDACNGRPSFPVENLISSIHKKNHGAKENGGLT